MHEGLEDDLNTAQAQAAIFDLIRSANAAMDAGQVKKDDIPLLLAALQKFDEIFAVLKDDDGPKMQAIAEWAKSGGREAEISSGLLASVGAQQLSDSDIERKVSEMEAARRARTFDVSDKLRAELAAEGIIVENAKDGVRWRRK
jgi:cysteinyl-tRNA synthetase